MSKLDDDPGIRRVFTVLVNGDLFGGTVVGQAQEPVATGLLCVYGMRLHQGEVGEPFTGFVAMPCKLRHTLCVVCAWESYERVIGQLNS